MGFFDDVDVEELNQISTESKIDKKKKSDVKKEEKELDALLNENPDGNPENFSFDNAIINNDAFLEEEASFEDMSFIVGDDEEKETVKSVSKNSKKMDVAPIMEPIKEEVKEFDKNRHVMDISKLETSRNNTKKDLGNTNVALGTVIHGGITSAGGVAVEGQVDGNIDAQTNVAIFKSGVVNGDIISHADTSSIVIRGKVSGSIYGAAVILEETKVVGNIEAVKGVHVKAGSVVIGDIKAKDIIIEGGVKGNLDINGRVLLKKGSVIKGDIKSKSMEMEPGAVCSGVCQQIYSDNNPDDFFSQYEN